jgi:hypothetical protein
MKSFIISTLISVSSLVFALVEATNMPEAAETFGETSIPATIPPDKFADERKNKEKGRRVLLTDGRKSD